MSSLEQSVISTKSPQQAEVGRALLVVNAKARQGQESFRLTASELQKQGIRLVEAYAVANPTKIKGLVEEILGREKIDTVLVGGGDGTVSVLADLLAHRHIQLGVIPLGTANDFARNLDIPSDITRAVTIIKEGYIQPVDLGLAGDRHFLNVASIGLGVQVARKMDDNLKKWLGPLAYAPAAAQALAEMRPIHVRLVFKDRPSSNGDGFQAVSYQALQIAIANGRFYGGGMVSAPNETITDSKLSVTVIEAIPIRELISLLPGLRDGTYVRHPKVHHYSTTDVMIETRHSHRINLDGEVCQRTPLSFKVSPAILPVFVPSSLDSQKVG